MRHRALLLGLFTLIGCFKRHDADQLTDTPKFKYQAGQVWKYKTRPTEPNSTFTVLRVDHWPDMGTVVHICVDDVRLDIFSLDTVYKTIEHMPFDEVALDSSALYVLRTTKKLPKSGDGYKQWHKDYLANEAGIYSCSVAKAVASTEEAVNLQNSFKE